MLVEEWKDIKGYEGRYQVSNLGRVRSLDREYNNRGTMVPIKGKMLSFNNCRGYSLVSLCKDDSKPYKAKVHRLVAEAFIPNPENKPCIDHINTDRTDNRVENLRWVTRKENMDNPLTKSKLASCRGKRIVATYQDGTETSFNSILDASRILKINRGTISRSIQGQPIYNNEINFKIVC